MRNAVCFRTLTILLQTQPSNPFPPDSRSTPENRSTLTQEGSKKLEMASDLPSLWRVLAKCGLLSARDIRLLFARVRYEGFI